MRYSQIRDMDISNGDGIGVALFVQGCHFHCDGCFNKETWDFGGGKLWTKEQEDLIIELLNKPYITRLSILGGEPLEQLNLRDLYSLLRRVVATYYNTKEIWLYTGYDYTSFFGNTENEDRSRMVREIFWMCDYVVDGQFIQDQASVDLQFCGSRNQRVINVPLTSNRVNKIKLYETEQ